MSQFFIQLNKSRTFLPSIKHVINHCSQIARKSTIKCILFIDTCVFFYNVKPTLTENIPNGGLSVCRNVELFSIK